MDFYETMSYFNRNVSKMDIEHKYKVELPVIFEDIE